MLLHFLSIKNLRIQWVLLGDIFLGRFGYLLLKNEIMSISISSTMLTLFYFLFGVHLSRFLQKNLGTFFLSTYDSSKLSEGSGKGKEN